MPWKDSKEVAKVDYKYVQISKKFHSCQPYQDIIKMGSPFPVPNAPEFGLFNYCKVGHIRAILGLDCPGCVRMVMNLQLLIPIPSSSSGWC